MSWDKVFTSLRQRGLQETLLAIGRQPAVYFAKLEDYWFDFRYGTDTMGKIPVAQLDVVGESVAHGTGYQATRARPFRKVIKAIAFPHDSVFVDVGSGKGRVLLLATEFNFKRIVGIEFSRQLCQIAEKNLALYRRGAKVESMVEVIHCDATQYQFEHDENIFFLSNPFDETLTQQVLNNIIASQQRYPRPIWLIYSNPVHLRLIAEKTPFVLINSFHFPGQGRNILVYTIPALGASSLPAEKAYQFD